MKVALLFMPCSVKDSCRHADFSRNRTWMNQWSSNTAWNYRIRTEDRKELSTNGVAMTTISVGQTRLFPSSETQGQIKGARESLNGRKNIYGTKKSKEWREKLFSPFFTFLRVIFSRPFRLSLAPTICPWVSEDVRSSARAWNSVILAGKRDSRRHSAATSFGKNVVVAGTSYQM